MKHMNIGKQMIKGVPSNLPESTRVVYYISQSVLISKVILFKVELPVHKKTKNISLAQCFIIKLSNGLHTNKWLFKKIKPTNTNQASIFFKALT